MKIKCIHGFFIIEETSVGQISDFTEYTGLVIVNKGPYYTFEPLVDAPNYTIEGAPLLDAVAIKTFAGEPWEVFEANEMVYDIQTGLMKPLASITSVVELFVAGNYYVANGLIQPGSITKEGQKITGYSAWFSRTTLTWKYSEVRYA